MCNKHRWRWLLLLLPLAALGLWRHYYATSGPRIVFVSNMNNGIEIYSMRIDGNDVRRLSPPADSYCWHYAPAVSPDGMLITYVEKSGKGDAFSLYLMRYDGRHRRCIKKFRGAERMSPVFSPDSKSIYYNRQWNILGYTDGSLYRLNIDGNDEQKINNIAAIGQISCSHDGTAFYYYSCRKNGIQIYRADTDGSHEIQLTNDKSSHIEPAISPDGKIIVYTSNKNGSDQIFVMDANGMRPRQISHEPTVAFDPSFSPDGKQIVYAIANPGSTSDIVTIRLDGSGRKQVTHHIDRYNFDKLLSKLGPTVSLPISRLLPADYAYDSSPVWLPEPK